MKTWEEYYIKYKDSIERWIKQFVPQAMLEYSETIKDREHLESLLNKIWFVAPDSPRIRTPDFFHVTDLLDESWSD
jgi:hypothetical protein